MFIIRPAFWSPKRWSSPPWPVLPLPTTGFHFVSFFIVFDNLLIVVECCLFVCFLYACLAPPHPRFVVYQFLLFFDVCLLFVVDDHMINGQWSLIILVGPSLPNVLSSTSIWSSWSCWSSWSSQLSWLSPQPWELRLREQGSKWAHRRCAWFLTFIWLNFMKKLTLPQVSCNLSKAATQFSIQEPLRATANIRQVLPKEPL